MMDEASVKEDILRLSREISRLYAAYPSAVQSDIQAASVPSTTFIEPVKVLSTTGTASYTQLLLGKYVPTSASAVILRVVYGYTADAGEKKLTVKPDSSSRKEFIIAWGAADASAEDVNSCGVCQVVVPAGTSGGQKSIYYKIDVGFDVKLDVYVDGYIA